MIRLVPCTLDDAMKVLTMRKEFYAIDQYPFDLQEQELLTTDFLLNPSLGTLYIILNADLVIGYICLTYSYSFEYGGKTAFIDEFYLHPDQRSKGYGNQIMDKIILIAKELKLATLHLEAESHNDRANQLYFKKGFKNANRNLLYSRLN